MQLRVTVLPGDGIGPEVTREAVAVLRAVAEAGGHEFRFDEGRLGGAAIAADGTPLPQADTGSLAGQRRGAAGRRGRQQV